MLQRGHFDGIAREICLVVMEKISQSRIPSSEGIPLVELTFWYRIISASQNLGQKDSETSSE